MPNHQRRHAFFFKKLHAHRDFHHMRRLCHMEKIDYVRLRFWSSGKIKRIAIIKFHLCGDGDALRPTWKPSERV